MSLTTRSARSGDSARADPALPKAVNAVPRTIATKAVRRDRLVFWGGVFICTYHSLGPRTLHRIIRTRSRRVIAWRDKKSRLRLSLTVGGQAVLATDRRYLDCC